MYLVFVVFTKRREISQFSASLASVAGLRFRKPCVSADSFRVVETNHLNGQTKPWGGSPHLEGFQLAVGIFATPFVERYTQGQPVEHPQGS